MLVIHLLDPGERELPAAGDARFFDPETGQELDVNVADVRSQFLQRPNSLFDSRFQRYAVQQGVRLCMGTKCQSLASQLRKAAGVKAQI